MGGFFGTVLHRPCAQDLFYGIDYHSHLGTKRAGMVTHDGERFHRSIHDIENSYFRTKFSDDLSKSVALHSKWVKFKLALEDKSDFDR